MRCGWRNGSYRDRGHVLKVGSIVLEGTGKDLLSSDAVRKAYLGEDSPSHGRGFVDVDR